MKQSLKSQLKKKNENLKALTKIGSVQFSRSVVSDSLRPHARYQHKFHSVFEEEGDSKDKIRVLHDIVSANKAEAEEF